MGRKEKLWSDVWRSMKGIVFVLKWGRREKNLYQGGFQADVQKRIACPAV